MPPPRTRTAAALRRLTALGLVAWLAGLGCVLGCAPSTGATASARRVVPPQSHAAPDESHSAEQSDSCAAMSGHGCCGGGRGEGRGEDEPRSVGAESYGGRAAMHCPLGRRHASDPARKVRFDTTPAAAAPAAQSPAPEPSYVAAARSARPHARDRGGTYLRCRVFLI